MHARAHACANVRTNAQPRPYFVGGEDAKRRNIDGSRRGLTSSSLRYGFNYGLPRASDVSVHHLIFEQCAVSAFDHDDKTDDDRDINAQLQQLASVTGGDANTDADEVR